MTAKEKILWLERIGLKELDDLAYDKQSKLAAIRSEIAIRCVVSTKTVRNWRSGARPGKQAMVLLNNYYDRKVKERVNREGKNRGKGDISPCKKGDNSNFRNEA